MPQSSRKSIVEHDQRQERLDRDPDSIRWQVDAEYILEHLNLEIGDQPFEEWAELVWPGDSIDNFTWKQLSKMAIEALDAACKGICEIEELARRRNTRKSQCRHVTELEDQMSNQLAVRDEMGIADVAQAFVKSGYFSDAADVSKAVVKILAGRAFGFGPFASVTNIYIIQGRPSLGANLMASAVKSNPRYDYRIRKMNDAACEIEFFQRAGDKWESLGISAFSLDDARKAGTKNLDRFPRNMLFARAMSNGVRWYCPDVFGTAVYTPEELGADVNEEGEVIQGSVVEVPAQPQPEPKHEAKAQPLPHMNGNGFNPVAILVEGGIAENGHEAATILNKYVPKGVKSDKDQLLAWGKLYR